MRRRPEGRWRRSTWPRYSRPIPTGASAMHLFKEQGVKDIAAAASQIPVIDYGPYFAGEPGALDRLVPQVRHACENVGFFYISGHGVPDAIVDDAFAAARRFHALP